MKLESVQQSLSKVPCPVCQKSKSMSAVLRCDLGLDACLVTIVCDSCKSLFELGEQHSAHCPDCGTAETSSRILCDVTSQRFFVRPEPCETCKQVAKAA